MDDSERQTIVKVAVEIWRVKKVFAKALEKLDASEQARYNNQFSWFFQKTSEAIGDLGISVVDITGQPFVPGMATSPINLDEFSEDDNLVVDQMLDPIVMGNDGLLKMGTIMLRKVSS